MMSNSCSQCATYKKMLEATQEKFLNSMMEIKRLKTELQTTDERTRVFQKDVERLKEAESGWKETGYYLGLERAAVIAPHLWMVAYDAYYAEPNHLQRDEAAAVALAAAIRAEKDKKDA